MTAPCCPDPATAPIHSPSDVCAELDGIPCPEPRAHHDYRASVEAEPCCSADAPHAPGDDLDDEVGTHWVGGEEVTVRVDGWPWPGADGLVAHPQAVERFANPQGVQGGKGDQLGEPEPARFVSPPPPPPSTIADMTRRQRPVLSQEEAHPDRAPRAPGHPMSGKTGIRWTASTWNPILGCSKVSPGCANCYAETLSLRYGWTPEPWTPANAAVNVQLKPHKLDLPLRWPDPRRVFVNSMSDLFHELAPIDYIARVFAVMAVSERHTFQVLTKRPERMAGIVADPTFRGQVADHVFAHTDVPRNRRGDHRLELLDAWDDAPGFWPLPNVWLGTSIENDRHVFRADHLRETPAAIRFISAEPLLGPLPSLDLSSIDWLIVGGESGPGYRPMDREWARQLRDRAVERGVAYFFKQSAAPRTLDGRRWEQFPDDEIADPFR